MWKSHRLRFALPCSLALAFSVHAASPNPIAIAIFDATSCKMAALEMSLATGAEGLKTAHDRLLDARAKLDGHIAAAVASTKGKPDLRTAVKEFYAAASAYCQNPSRQLENSYSTKEQALRLEMKLSGM